MPTSFRLHPTINFARVGTSDNFYLSPETSAGLPVAGEEHLLGGLPIKRGTENEPISSDDLRDADGNLLRQAARFRIYVYDFAPPDSYPDRRRCRGGSGHAARPTAGWSPTSSGPFTWPTRRRTRTT